MGRFNKYRSGEDHGSIEAEKYSKTICCPHRFLAYRDFPNLVKGYKNIDKVLDFGSGAGASTDYLAKRGYDVLGTDKSQSMLDQAKLNFPDINFINVKNLDKNSRFDLVFSSFVLFELSSKAEIVNYLKFSAEKLMNNGLFLGITGSEHLHKKSRRWMSFEVNFQENRSPRSGDLVKLVLKDPEILFYDYFWKEADYRECFKLSGLELIKVYYPLGYKNEGLHWKDEIFYPPFMILIAKKTEKN